MFVVRVYKVVNSADLNRIAEKLKPMLSEVAYKTLLKEVCLNGNFKQGFFVASDKVEKLKKGTRYREVVGDVLVYDGCDAFVWLRQVSVYETLGISGEGE